MSSITRETLCGVPAEEASLAPGLLVVLLVGSDRGVPSEALGLLRSSLLQRNVDLLGAAEHLIYRDAVVRRRRRLMGSAAARQAVDRRHGLLRQVNLY